MSLIDCKLVTVTHVNSNIKLLVTDGEILLDVNLYRKLVGSLVYLTVTRLYISYVVHLDSQFVSSPCSVHYAIVFYILHHDQNGIHFS